MITYKLTTYPDPILDKQIEEITRCIRLIASFGDTNVSITVTGTAGASYTATEQGIINALIADVGTLRDEINELKGILNS